MVDAVTTNDVRRKLEGMGAERPGRTAVEMVALYLGSDGQTHYWEVCLPDEVICSAIQACAGKSGKESYIAFAAECKKRCQN